MNDHKPIGLLRTILSRVLPIAVVVLATASFIVSENVSRTIRLEAQLRLKENAERAADLIANKLDQQREYADTLATNELLINSLVDVEERQRYLPLFFRSLKTPGAVAAQIVMTDYRGRNTASNGSTESFEFANWLPAVMQGRAHFSISSNELIVAAPIKYYGNPEGMIVLKYESKTVKELLDVDLGDYEIAVFDNEGSLLSDLRVGIPVETLLNDKMDDDAWVQHHVALNRYPKVKVVALQSTARAHHRVRQASGYLITASLFSVIALAAGTVLTVRMAVKPLQALLGKIKATGDSDDLTGELKVQGAAEFQSLANSFNQMMTRLEHTTVSRDHLESLNEQLVAQTARMNAIVESATDAIITISSQGMIESANAAAEGIFGYSTDEMIGQNARMLMPTLYREEDGERLKEFELTRQNRIVDKSREVVGKRKDGSVLPLELSVSQVHLRDRLLFTGIIRDITERKNAEEKQEALLMEIEENAQQISAANRKLARSNEELKQFAYVASHDLQEPLRKVTSFCQMLSEEYGSQLDTDAQAYIRYAVNGAMRMRTLITDLLNYSRVESQGKSLEPTDVTEACSEAVENLRGTIEESNVQISVKPLPTILADRVQLVRLFQNLIGNAIKYRSERPPQIHISAREEHQSWTITIRDNGIGMEPQYYERIFVMFQRLHARDEYSGTGIGLAICKRIVDRMQGHIWVESELGSGSQFSISVPKLTTMPGEKVKEHELNDPSFAETH